MRLLQFLNEWGCRIKKVAHENGAPELLDWWQEKHDFLPSENRSLFSLTDEEMKRAGHAFCSLQHVQSSTKNGDVDVHFGPTGAAKILFALRPQALVPWDGAIRKTMKRKAGEQGKKLQDHSAELYIEWLHHAQVDLRDLKGQCEQRNFRLNDLPRKIGKPESTTVVKLIDEYYWVKHTKGIDPAGILDFLKGWQ